MSNAITRTYTFANGGVADGGQVDSEIANIVNTINNADAGTTIWTQVKSALLTMSGNIVMATNKITGLGNGSAAQDAVAYSQLHLLQIPIFASETTGGTTTNSSFVVAGATATITPTSTSSKILILGGGLFNVATSTDGHGAALGIARAGSALFSRAASPFSYITGGLSSTYGVSLTLFYLDSPATIAATAYQLMIASNVGGDTVTFGGAAATGSATYILLAEVG